MATVPLISGPTVETAALPGAYQSVPQGLGNAAAANQQLLAQAGKAAGALVDFQQRQQNRDDLDVVFRTETALKDDYLKFEREELGKNGVNAKGATERAQQWWNEANTKYGEGLTDRQMFAFKRSAAQLRQASASALGRHEQHQSNESLKESAQARIGTAIQSAIADPTPERLGLSRKEITEAVNIAGNLAGYTPEIAAAKTKEALTLMHHGVVMQLVDSDPDAARAYFYSNKKEINGTTAVTLEKALERGGILKKSQEAADEIMVKFGEDLPSAMKHIEEKYSGETEKAIKTEVTERYSRSKGAKQAMSQTAYETALLHTVQGQRVPAAVWSQMDDGHKAAIIEKREAEAKQRKAEAEGKPIKTDFAAWDQLNRMVTADRAGFAALDLGRFADRISVQDRMEFANIQRDIRSGGGKSHDVVTLQQQIGTTVDQLKLVGANNAEKRGQLEHAIVTEIRARQQGGVKLSDQERQEVIDKQIMQMAVPGFLWDSKKPLYQLTPEERAKAKVVVPDGDRQLITEALKAKGRPVNEEEILKLYKRQKGIQ